MNDVMLMALQDELEKIAKAKNWVLPTLAALGIGGATYGGVQLAIGEKGRARVHREHRDPRLYSNLRGMVTGESRKERVAAHKRLGKPTGSVWDAMKMGFGRHKGQKKKKK